MPLGLFFGLGLKLMGHLSCAVANGYMTDATLVRFAHRSFARDVSEQKIALCIFQNSMRLVSGSFRYFFD